MNTNGADWSTHMWVYILDTTSTQTFFCRELLEDLAGADYSRGSHRLCLMMENGQMFVLFNPVEYFTPNVNGGINNAMNDWENGTNNAVNY